MKNTTQKHQPAGVGVNKKIYPEESNDSPIPQGPYLPSKDE